jgi:hypothetical protein
MGSGLFANQITCFNWSIRGLRMLIRQSNHVLWFIEKSNFVPDIDACLQERDLDIKLHTMFERGKSDGPWKPFFSNLFWN